jgi:hypothetical protein
MMPSEKNFELLATNSIRIISKKHLDFIMHHITNVVGICMLPPNEFGFYVTTYIIKY